MVKKSSISTNDTDSNSIFNLISSIDDSAEILAESTTAVIKDYIDTGNYILNAAMTGSLFKGVPAGRIVTLAGESGCGKSFLALSICRQAQKKGYTPIYLDSESAIDIDFVERLGCDPSKFIIKQVMTISEVATFIASLCKKMLDMPENKREELKPIIVIDSLSNLTSDKEYNDTLEGNEKRDMTKQQEIKKLFRTNATNLGKLGIPVIVNSHTYMTQDLFAKTVVSGGTGIAYNASITMLMTKSKLDDKESDKLAEKKIGDFMKTGVTVTCKSDKSRFTIPQKVQFHIPFFKAPNPYVGLDRYINWENSGILEGILLDEKGYNKLSELEKKTVEEFEFEGVKMYAYPKVAGIQKNRTIVVRHLGKQLPLTCLFTSTVLNDEVLHNLDEKVIKPNFELPKQEAEQDLSELVDMKTGEIL